MNIRLSLEKEEFEPMLLELLKKALQRDVTPSEIQSISLSYTSEGGKMEVSMKTALLNNQ